AMLPAAVYRFSQGIGRSDTDASDSRFKGLPLLPGRLPRIPNRRRDVAVASGRIVVVVDGDDLAVGPLHAARVAEVVAAAIAAENDLGAPRRAAVAAEGGGDAVRGGTVTIGEAGTTVLQADQARWVALARVGRWRGLPLPVLAVVEGAVHVDPALRALPTANRRKQLPWAQPNGRRHACMAYR